MTEKRAGKALKAWGAALAILAVAVAIVLGLQLVGIGTGWIVLLSLTAYLMVEKTPSKASLAPFVCGGLLGMLAGQLFGLFPPGFLLFALALIACKIGGWLPALMNDYTLLYMTVYSIPGVCNPQCAWQDLVVFGGFCIILAAAVIAMEKKGGAEAPQAPETPDAIR
ncbi:MAG: hypothetical protein IJO87_07400 [Eggerthellaceae bacterium]|nr:hypothetical protein [Eggerthellaceae bacterium]